MKYTKEEIQEALEKFKNAKMFSCSDPLPIKLPFDLEIEGERSGVARNLYFEDYLYPKYNKMNKAGVFNGITLGRVLDLGFGSGCIPIYFLKKGFEVTAVSLNEKSIERMELIKKIYNFKLSLIKSDITVSFNYKDFDLILLLGIIHHLKEETWLPLIKNCYNALRPFGAMVIETKGHVPCIQLLKDVGFKNYRLIRTAWHRPVYRGEK